METVYVTLNEAAFRELVAGRVVSIGGRPGERGVRVDIILSDIGYARMTAAIIDATQERPPAG